MVPTFAAPVPKQPEKPSGILVLDDCDPAYTGKAKYGDCLTKLDSTGRKQFRLDGFNNNDNSIGSSRMIATNITRKCIWVVENVAHQIRRFDLDGKETLTIHVANGHAVAVDPVTGNVWVLAGAVLGQYKTFVFDDTGKEIATYDVSGEDIVYDRFSKSFWIADKKLTKIEAATAKVTLSTEIPAWTAVSLDVEMKTGAVWVAVRKHQHVPNSNNKLLKYSVDGKRLLSIDLEENGPIRVSVDPNKGSVWCAYEGKAVEQFSAAGKSEIVHLVEALAVQADPAGDAIWVVTPTEIQKLSAKGELLASKKHAAKTGRSWITAFE